MYRLKRSKKNSVKRRKKIRQSKKRNTMKGGSPASNRVMSFLPSTCGQPQNITFEPVSNNISNTNLYQTTGGGRKLKGGAIRMPSEYFGIDSGRYMADANVGRSPSSYGYVNQAGGAIRMPSEYYGVDSGRYTADANVGRSPSCYGYVGHGGGKRPNYKLRDIYGGFVRDGSIQHFRGLQN